MSELQHRHLRGNRRPLTADGDHRRDRRCVLRAHERDSGVPGGDGLAVVGRTVQATLAFEGRGRIWCENAQQQGVQFSFTIFLRKELKPDNVPRPEAYVEKPVDGPRLLGAIQEALSCATP